MLRWGRPEAAVGGEVGRVARGKGAAARGGEGGNWPGRRRGGALVIIYYLKNLKNLKNICVITILMIASILVFLKIVKFCFWDRKNKIEFLEKKV